MTGLLPIPGGSVADQKRRAQWDPATGTWRFPEGRVYSATAQAPRPAGGVPTKTKVNQTAKAAVVGANTWLGDLQGKDRDAAAALISLFEQYGLGSLANRIVDYVKKGYGSDTIALLLQETPEWKQRFAANETRRKAGLSVLSPAEYLSVERSYRQVMQEYGLPKGFYDSYSDFQKFIAQDMSATELQGRVQVASAWANNQDAHTKEALRKLYGLGTGDLAAYALDSNRALPLLEKQARAVSIASEAQRMGLGYTRAKSEYFADMGITGEQARAAYGTIQEMLPVFNQLGHIYGESYTQGTAEDELFENKGEATAKRKKLESQERKSFGGSSRGSVGGRSSGSSY